VTGKSYTHLPPPRRRPCQQVDPPQPDKVKAASFEGFIAKRPLALTPQLDPGRVCRDGSAIGCTAASSS